MWYSVYVKQGNFIIRMIHNICYTHYTHYTTLYTQSGTTREDGRLKTRNHPTRKNRYIPLIHSIHTLYTLRIHSAYTPHTLRIHLIHLYTSPAGYNRLAVFTGWEDAPLIDSGRAEARKAGQLLKVHGFEFDVVYTSWLSRAVETAYIGNGSRE